MTYLTGWLIDTTLFFAALAGCLLAGAASDAGCVPGQPSPHAPAHGPATCAGREDHPPDIYDELLAILPEDHPAQVNADTLAALDRWVGWR